MHFNDGDMDQYLIEILLPVTTPGGPIQTAQVLSRVKETLVEAFGGVTAYTRSPAQGIWAPAPGTVQYDEVMIVEVMVTTIDSAWWTAFRLDLEKELQQLEIVMRALPIRRL